MKECKGWQRARRDEQIEQREIQILEAASKLFDQHRYEDISLAMIAKKAGFTRSNLYRYFPTREDVFLTLMTEDLDRWVTQVEQLFVEKDLSEANFVERWLPIMLENPRMLRFYELLAGVLEEKASTDRVLAFKRHLHSQSETIIARLCELKLFASAERAQRFLITHLGLISGLFPKLALTEHHQAILQQTEFSESPSFYRALLEEGVQALYRQYHSTVR